VRGDVETWITNMQVTRDWPAVRHSRELLATAGDRIALERVVLTGGADGGAFESEFFRVTETDADGRLVALIQFDADDRRAAMAEIRERFSRPDADRRFPAAALDLQTAINARDFARFRSLIPDDYVFDDHRRTGVGRLADADAYVASLLAVYEETPDAHSENLCYFAQDAHGYVALARTFGTLASGGEFESLCIRLSIYDGDRNVTVELFEIEDLDAARARFEALGPNIATVVTAAGGGTRSS
jgi:hypothetical protein